ncbi:hypothetical protein MNBD_GAMMA12-251 [hydrothermal vent metagenome]|uniref:Glycosyltransferase 2-like domain-containing protein n=1 Tax=hydrothermal vent metagenome TaxID=652676 RepID=A0A3B0YS28_9ZZZZ
MQTFKKISVIIPLLNETKNLLALLYSLQILRSQGHEIIVVDGGSTDGSLQQLKALVEPNQKLSATAVTNVDDTGFLIDSLLESTPGRAIQMNLGATLATGDLLWFVHADSTLSTEVIKALMQLSVCHALAMKPRIGLWGWFNIKLSGNLMSLKIIQGLMNFRSRMSSIATGDQAMFVDKNLFEQVGRFQEIPIMEDIALSQQLKKICRPVRLKNKLITSSRRWEKNGVWRTVFLMWRLRWEYALGKDPVILAQRYRNNE